jgi:membrane-bound metal-dependent hydrolase YbcI (DUF457 family)
MRWRSHALIGAILAVFVFWVLGTRDILSLAAFAVFASLSGLVPDLDHDSSKGKKILDTAFILLAVSIAIASGCGGSVCIPSSFGGLGSMIALSLVMMGAYFMAFKLFKPRHRGITHTLTAGFVFGIIVYLLAGSALALAGSIGYFSHLIADGIVKTI